MGNPAQRYFFCGNFCGGWGRLALLTSTLTAGTTVGEALFELVEGVEPRAEGEPDGRGGGDDVGAERIGECELRLGAELLGIDDAEVVAREVALQQLGYLGHIG